MCLPATRRNDECRRKYIAKLWYYKERIHTERFHTGQARKRSVEADAKP